MSKYIIRSVERDIHVSYFVTFHGFTPMFHTKEMAQTFPTFEAAQSYARSELFVSDRAFEIVTINQ